MTSKEIVIIFSENTKKPLKTLGRVPLVILVAIVTKLGNGRGGNAVKRSAEYGCKVKGKVYPRTGHKAPEGE
jgi:hypothetical protein